MAKTVQRSYGVVSLNSSVDVSQPTSSTRCLMMCRESAKVFLRTTVCTGMISTSSLWVGTLPLLLWIVRAVILQKNAFIIIIVIIIINPGLNARKSPMSHFFLTR